MRRGGLVLGLWLACGAVMLTACQPAPHRRTPAEEQMFGAVSMRIHPTFTQIKDWTGDGKADGVEAVLEFEDQFDEPTRAAGTVRFELSAYREADPQRAGRQLATPWTFSLNTPAEQSAHWNPAVRGYSFQLPFAQISSNHTYVLSAQMDTSSGRLFDQLILEPMNKGAKRSERRTEHAPSDGPGHSR